MSTEITNNPSADRLHEFVAVIEEGSISAASRRMGIPRATLSRRLTGLEAELGVRLLHRQTRRLVLTEAGEQLYARARNIVADTDEAWAATRRVDDAPRGPLRVSTTFASGVRDLFAAFARDYPAVRLEVTSSVRHVDLVTEGIDVAIRGGVVSDPNLIVRKLFDGRSIAVASPAYLERWGVPERPADLSHHQIIADFRGTNAPSRTWPLVGGGEIKVPHHLASTDMQMRIEWALADLGITLAPTAFVNPHVHAGRLVHVLDGEIGAPAPLSLVYADREFQAPQIRAFIDRAVEFFLGPHK